MKTRWFLKGVFVLGVLALLAGGCASGPGPVGTTMESHVSTVPGMAVPPPEQRPGLATRWGELRESRVNATEFRRADRAEPRATFRVYYNDRVGMDAFFAKGREVPRVVTPPIGVAYGQVEYGLRDASGNWLQTWAQDGRTYVEGKRDERFTVVVRNGAVVRREFVISVDGLDVLDGQPASVRKRGYVLQPGEEFSVEGFRTSDSTVAAFRFGTVSESYSQQRHGHSENIGVIGIAIFEELSKDLDRRTEANPFPRRWATGP